MPARAKSLAEWRADYTAEGRALVAGLERVFNDTRLFPSKPRAVLPKLEINGSTSGPGAATPPSGLTGMMVTVRVADLGLTSTVPKAKPLSARRRRGKLWALKPFSLIFERI